ncbi:hypothetical protein [Reyranella sp.]|uniref:hypothetical protein n=1 Tax=Reyranella sp. TaxID=1929291 RepID=UPI003C7D595A
MPLEIIASDYIARFRGPAIAEMTFYKEQPSLSEAIRLAALSRTAHGKRHAHQRRIPGHVLEAAEQSLQGISASLGEARSFDEVHHQITNQIGSLRGIGELAIYDFSHRIGAFLKLAPDLVYLHAGTRVGARALNLTGDVIPKSAIPSAFHFLSAAEIEDCLCIYKSLLKPGTIGRISRSLCMTVKRPVCH